MIEVPAVVRLVDLSLADVYRDTGDVDRQIAVLRRVVTANNGWLPGRERLAIALLQSGRVDEAVQEYRSLASRAGLPITAPLNFARLLILQNLGRDAARQNWEPVTSLLEKLDQEEALAGEVAVLRAEMLSSQDRVDEARQVLATAIETVDKASSEAVWSARILLEVSQDQDAAALQMLDLAHVAIGDPPSVRYAAALAMVSGDRSLQPDKLADIVRPEDGWDENETLDFQRNIIPLLISAQAYDLAEQVVAEVMEQRVGDVTTRLQMLEIASRSGKIDRMGDVLADLQRIAGKTARWHFGNALLITANASPTSASQGTPQAAAAGSVPASQSTTNQLTDANNRKAQEHLAEAAVLRPDWNAVPATLGSTIRSCRRRRKRDRQVLPSGRPGQSPAVHDSPSDRAADTAGTLRRGGRDDPSNA